MQLEFLTGQAGTGKTFEIKRRVKEDKKYGTLAATTGIAAVNLAGSLGDAEITTINSLLKYFDSESLEECYATGKLHQRIKALVGKTKFVVIDEISMASAMDLDIWFKAFSEVNELKTVQDRGGIGLVLTGDFCQLPPVNGRYAFYANCWKRFEPYVQKLTTVYRQTDPKFLEALNAARGGYGDLCAASLYDTQGVTFDLELDTRFEGTTIFGRNKNVDRLNGVRLQALLTCGAKPYTVSSWRWGSQRSEWKQIPRELELAQGAYVMVLSNNPPDFSYVNGDCGHLVECAPDQKVCWVKLVRTAAIVRVGPVERQVTTKRRDYLGLIVPREPVAKSDWQATEPRERKWEFRDEPVEIYETSNYNEYLDALTNYYRETGEPYWDFRKRHWVLGAIFYCPVRLAYASTVHKTQGLSLDRVQIDYGDGFIGEPSMSYVALSRCRTPEGVRIVGSPQLLAKRTNISIEVVPWL